MIRPFLPGDIPAVVALFQEVFHPPATTTSASLADRFRRLYFESPWCDPELPSLVCEDKSGIVGFLGVFPRKMKFRGETIRLAVSSNFMVRRQATVSLAAVALMRRFFEGPQELSLAQSSLAIRRFWESMGGVAVPLYSLTWTRPLRLGSFALHSAGLAPGSFWRRCATPATYAIDQTCQRLVSVPSRAGVAPDEDCSLAEQLEVLQRIAGSYDVFPAYTAESLGWLWREIEQRPQGAERLVRRLVRNDRGEPLGCYSYLGQPGGMGEVLQVAAPNHGYLDVFAHMLHDAGQRGLVGLNGNVNPAAMHAMEDRLCWLRRYGSWALVHSRRREFLDAFWQARVFLSRLEDEWLFFKM